MNVIYLGCNGFPFGFAEVQKQKMISKSIVEAGGNVTILNYKGILKKDSVPKVRFMGNVEGIEYIYSSLNAFRRNNLITRNFLKIVGRFGEFAAIFLLRKRKKTNIAILSTRSVYNLIYYFLILRLFGYKIVLSYEEFVKVLFKKKGVHSKFDDLVCKYCDAILPISSFLEDYQKQRNPNIKSFKIPALTDFAFIDGIQIQDQKGNTILFCGSSSYFENIKFVLDSFENVKNMSVDLILIINGNDYENSEIIKYIETRSSKKHRVHVYSNLSFIDLIKLYKKASLLLIPLKANERDIARFPHKISEYTACRIPMLTTAVGEINQYFTNGVDAFIVQKFDLEEYGKQIDFILENRQMSSLVGQNAYNLGRNKFDYKSISSSLYDFLSKL